MQKPKIYLCFIHVIRSKVGHFAPEEFEDRYEKALKELTRKKQQGKKIEKPKEHAPAEVISLMDALRRSVDERLTRMRIVPDSIRTTDKPNVFPTFEQTAPHADRLGARTNPSAKRLVPNARPELRITGQATALAKQKLKALGWNVVENVRF